MGMDIEIIAYRGRALSDAQIAALVSQFIEETEWFRHSTASAIRAPILDDLHCIGFYEDVFPDDGVEPSTKQGPSLSFSEEQLRGIQQRAGGRDASLASIVQAAWGAVREEVRKLPVTPRPREKRTPAGFAIARELSKLCRETFLVGYADHSCVGIYGRFGGGALVEPEHQDEVYSDRGDYTTRPERAWSAALDREVTFDRVIRAYFPDGKKPPLHAADDAEHAIPYDGNRFKMTMVG